MLEGSVSSTKSKNLLAQEVNTVLEGLYLSDSKNCIFQTLLTVFLGYSVSVGNKEEMDLLARRSTQF